jgi:hypothetical protein
MSSSRKKIKTLECFAIFAISACQTWPNSNSGSKTSVQKDLNRPRQSIADLITSGLASGSKKNRQDIALALEETLQFEAKSANDENGRRIFETQIKSAVKALRLGSDHCEEKDKLELYRVSSNATQRSTDGKLFSISEGIRSSPVHSLNESLRIFSPSFPVDYSYHTKAHSESEAKSLYISATLKASELAEAKSHEMIQVLRLCPGRYFPFSESDTVKHEVLIFGFLLPEEIKSEFQAKDFAFSGAEQSPLSLCEHFKELEFAESFRTTFEGLSQDFVKKAASVKSTSLVSMKRMIELKTQTNCTCEATLDASNEIATFSGVPQMKSEFCDSEVKLLTVPRDIIIKTSDSLTKPSPLPTESCQINQGQVIKYFLAEASSGLKRIWLAEPIPSCPLGPLYMDSSIFL